MKREQWEKVFPKFDSLNAKQAIVFIASSSIEDMNVWDRGELEDCIKMFCKIAGNVLEGKDWADIKTRVKKKKSVQLTYAPETPPGIAGVCCNCLNGAHRNCEGNRTHDCACRKKKHRAWWWKKKGS